MINADLNRDAHGKYIFLCYQNGLDEDDAIADITFITNSQTVPDGYVKMPQDLNEGAGGNYIWLAYSYVQPNPW